jgi:hypothetical protein
VHPLRIIARISRQLLRTHLRQRFGLQIATCASVIAPHSVHLPKHVDMPIASCHFVIARLAHITTCALCHHSCRLRVAISSLRGHWAICTRHGNKLPHTISRETGTSSFRR